MNHCHYCSHASVRTWYIYFWSINKRTPMLYNSVETVLYYMWFLRVFVSSWPLVCPLMQVWNCTITRVRFVFITIDHLVRSGSVNDDVFYYGDSCFNTNSNCNWTQQMENLSWSTLSLSWSKKNIVDRTSDVSDLCWRFNDQNVYHDHWLFWWQVFTSWIYINIIYDVSVSGLMHIFTDTTLGLS